MTFLFSDIEGSTRLLRQLRGAFDGLLADHTRLLDAAITTHGGRVVSARGDELFAVFGRARDAIAAAAGAQRSFAEHAWPGGVVLRVRMGVHTGEPLVEGDRYVGLAVHRAARIMALAQGGQVLVSGVTAELVADDPVPGVELGEVGRVGLKDFDRPEAVFQLVIDGLHVDHPPLRGQLAAEPTATADPATADAEGRGVEVRVLGAVEVWRDGVSVKVGAAKQRMILALLALRVGEVVSTDRLIDAVWGERPPVTASKALQVYVSELRKLVEPDRSSPTVVVTQPPGYRLGVSPDRVDLSRFERLWEQGRVALEDGRADEAAGLIGEALSLWRGPPLADFSYEPAFDADIGRLEELRLACVEDRIDADLARCGHAKLVSELEKLVGEYPLRERVRGQLMLALYRSGRQADALASYQQAREALVDELGIDPSPGLVTLERQILQQDESLNPPTRGNPAPQPALAPGRTVLVVSQSSSDVESLLAVSAPLAGDDEELVLARVLTALPGRDNRDRLRELTRRLSERRDQLHADGTNARTAAFSSADPGADLIKLAVHQDAALIVIDGSRELREGRSTVAHQLLLGAPCDVALSVRSGQDEPQGDHVLVPFGGSEHDWAALELAALIAPRRAVPLVIAGSQARGDGSDASRLLANASLILQRTSGVTPEPILIAPGPRGLLEAAVGAQLLVLGLSSRYREEGLGETRHAIIQAAATPSLFVRRGSRPGILAPQQSMTRFNWSVASSRQ